MVPGAVIGFILAYAAFLASSFREPDPFLATGCPIAITQSAGFDLWTGLPHGKVYERDCPSGPTEIHDPVPADMQGRRAVSLPDAFPVTFGVRPSCQHRDLCAEASTPRLPTCFRCPRVSEA